MILVATSLPWFHSARIFQRLYFYFVPGHLFSMCYTFQTDDYKTARWNSLEPCFHLEIDAVFYSCIDHGLTYNSLLELIKNKRYFRNYQMAFLLNLKMFNYVVC